jgi:hypothetical protein
MKKTNEIDYSKLLGFGTVGDLISGSVDFQDEMLGARCAMIHCLTHRLSRRRNNCCRVEGRVAPGTGIQPLARQ